MSITLPEDVTCVCLGEHDIGAFSANIKCHICNKLCDDLDTLNKHIASVHRMSHILVGHNILFERPDPSHVKPAFFCPMVKCKYHIAESYQSKYFKSFKLLKQHYVKMHASKEISCPGCEQKFASQLYLDSHSKSCGLEFPCQDCGSKFQSVESLQTHCRRKSHTLTPGLSKSKRSADPLVVDKLAILKSYSRPGKIPIAPRPSTMHINAAIALSELSATQIFTPRADIGVQTDADIWRQRKSVTPAPALAADSLQLSPSKRASAETQTRAGSGRKRCYKVSSQVQTLGEFSVRAKKARLEEETMSTTETQCRMSPEKRVRASVTTMTSVAEVLDLCRVEVPGSVADQEGDYLWPLRSHTSGTQTSPRIPRLPSKLSEEEDEDNDGVTTDVGDLQLPSLETVETCTSKTKFGETRQFSTETQTELDIFLDNYEDVERLLTTEMETQTHEDDENLLLLANNYTQTGTEDFLSALIIGGDSDADAEVEQRAVGVAGPSLASNPFKLEYVCSAETQTRLTAFQEPSLLLQMDSGQVMINNTETQTQDAEIVDFMEM